MTIDPSRRAGRRAVKRALAAAAIAASLVLTGCGLEDPGTELPASGLKQRTATLEDGRKVVCLTWKRANAGGMSCDWAGAKR